MLALFFDANISVPGGMGFCGTAHECGIRSRLEACREAPRDFFFFFGFLFSEVFFIQVDKGFVLD